MNILKINLKRWSLIFLALTTQTIKSEMVLDETFGVGGVIRNPFEVGGMVRPGPWINIIKIQTDGKILITNAKFPHHSAALIRYTADGALDVTFGTNGVVRLVETANSIAFQHDQKIIITSGDTISRYNSNGTPDRSFGHNGEVQRPSISVGNALVTHDKLIFAEKYSLEWYLSCYNLDGTLDMTFSPDQNGMSPLHTRDFSRNNLALQADGKIVALKENHGIAYLERYNQNGFLDTTFGPNNTGSFIVWGDQRLTIQPQTNKIITAGRGIFNDQSFLARYNPDGALDTTFGLDGTGMVMLNNGILPQEIRTQADDKIIITTSNGLLTRYNQDGTLDRSFQGEDGNPIRANLFALQPDNKIIISTADNSIRRYRALSPQEIEERRLAALATQEAARIEAEVHDLMRIELSEQCQICLEEAAIQNLIETECQHLFHPACMTNWRTSGQPAAHTCPSCRTALPPHNGGNQ